MYEAQLPESLKAVIRSKNIQKLADTSSLALGCPVVIMDASFHILSRSFGSMPADAQESVPVQQRYTPVQTFSTPDPEHEPQEHISYFLNTDPLGRPSRWARCGLSVGPRTVGYLCAVLGKDAPTPELEELMECISRFALALLISQQPSGVFGSREQFFFTTLIDSPAENRNEALLDSQCLRLGISLKAHKYLLTTHMHPQNYSYPIALESLLLEFMAAVPGGTAFLYKENITCIFSLDEISSSITHVLSPLLPVLRKSGLACGVSADFGSLTGTNAAYTQAIRALDLGSRLDPGGLMFAYEDLCYFDMMSICEKSADLLSFCHPAIRRLLQYDAEHGSSHLATLCAYLRSGCSMIKTAAELDLHRNTIKYRISQISQIIGLELGENMDSFPLLRSLDILKYMGITG